MINVVGVRFEQNGKMIYFDVDAFSPSMGDYVVAQSAKGPDLGEVIMGVRPVDETVFKTAIPKILRIATEQDIQHATDNRNRETEAFYIAQRKIADHHLEMKLVSVECMFDNSKMIFYFTANGRVDFRALVKDLASHFKTRIELRQIGVRDEARVLGGLGPCGRPICCGAFLKDFQPVSIKMAKEQNLSLNPTKISGVCGRLMCCLKYEEDQYEQTRKRMPRVGREVITPDGPGIVSDLNIVKETVKVRIARGDDFEIREYPLDQISRPGAAPAMANRSGEEHAAQIAEMDDLPDVPDLSDLSDLPVLAEMEEMDEISLEAVALEEDFLPSEPSTPERTQLERSKSDNSQPERSQSERSQSSRSKSERSQPQRARRPDRGVAQKQNPVRDEAEQFEEQNPSPDYDDALLDQFDEDELLQEELFRGKQQRKPRPSRPGNPPKKSDRKQNRDGKQKNRNQKDGAKADRNDSKKHLGQPVRRENPSKAKDMQADRASYQNKPETVIAASVPLKAENTQKENLRNNETAYRTANSNGQAQREQKPRSGFNSGSSWAEALEKAMRQADGKMDASQNQG